MRPDCTKCKHYKMTWEAGHPHACKLLGFKSAEMPATAAFKASGTECEGFYPKKPKSPDASHVIDSNDAVIISIDKGKYNKQ